MKVVKGGGGYCGSWTEQLCHGQCSCEWTRHKSPSDRTGCMRPVPTCAPLAPALAPSAHPRPTATQPHKRKSHSHPHRL
jgi:hypothetical protein